MSVIRIMTNFNIELEFPAAPFHRRLLAWILDIIFLGIFLKIAGEIVSSLRSSESYTAASAVGIFVIVVAFSYHLICEIFLNGQSLGKKITGIQVVNENGGQPSIGQFFIRWLIRTSDLMAVVIIFMAVWLSETRNPNLDTFMFILVPLALFITDIILVNASQKNQRLGDMLANTLLIRTAEKHSITDTVFLNVQENYVPSYPQVMRLSDRDINSLKGILDTARKRHDYNLAEMASNKIRNHLQIQTTMSPFDFLEVLLKDYNYLSTN